MKIFILLRPDYDGDEIIGVFSSKEKAHEQMDRGYWNFNSLQIAEYETDPIFGLKYEPYFSHERSAMKDYGVQEIRASYERNHIPNEHVWNSLHSGLQARGLGFTQEEATKRMNELLIQYANIPVKDTSMPEVTIPRPELVRRHEPK